MPDKCNISTVNTNKIFDSVACRSPLKFNCFHGERIEFLSASFGLIDDKACPAPYSIYKQKSSNDDETKCQESSVTLKILQKKCYGLTECTITMQEPFPNRCPCQPFQYLTFDYMCSSYRIRCMY